MMGAFTTQYWDSVCVWGQTGYLRWFEGPRKSEDAQSYL